MINLKSIEKTLEMIESLQNNKKSVTQTIKLISQRLKVEIMKRK